MVMLGRVPICAHMYSSPHVEPEREAVAYRDQPVNRNDLDLLVVNTHAWYHN